MQKRILSLLFSFGLSTVAFAQGVGELDPTFANSGRYTEDFGFHDNLNDIQVQSDGKILTVGTAINTAFSGQLLIKRINADGTSDNTFSSDGTVIINDYTESYAYAAHILPDGKILVAGSIANEQYQFSLGVFKLNADGSFDTAFGNNGHAIFSLVAGDTQVYDMAIDANGKIVVVGNMVPFGEFGKPIICRLNSDGSMDTSFADNGVATFTNPNDDNLLRNVAIDNDGRIVAAGHWGQGITGDGQINNDALVVRLLPDGTADATFGTEGKLIFPIHNYTEDLFGLELTANNEIYVCGYTMLNDFTYNGVLAKINDSGELITTFDADGVVEFDAGPHDVFADMKIYEDQLYIGGTSGGFGFENRDFMVIRYELDGTVDESFGISGATFTTIFASFDDANALTIQSDDKILLAGKGNNANNNDAAITRYLNNSNVSVANVHASEVQLFPNLIEAGEMINAQWNTEDPNEIIVYNSNGQCVKKERIASGSKRMEISTESLVSGMYQIVLSRNGMTLSQGKIVIH